MAASPQYIEGRGAADKKGARLRRGLCRKVVFQGATALWAEGGGIAMGPRSGPGSEGSKGSKGSEGGGIALSGDEFYCRLSAAGVTEFSRRSSVILSEAKDLGKNSK